MQKIANSLDAEGKVSYSVVVPNGIRISVATFNELLNGSFDELAHFGKIPSEQQRQKWLAEEGGKEADKQRLTEIARQKIRRQCTGTSCYYYRSKENDKAREAST